MKTNTVIQIRIIDPMGKKISASELVDANCSHPIAQAFCNYRHRHKGGACRGMDSRGGRGMVSKPYLHTESGGMLPVVIEENDGDGWFYVRDEAGNLLHCHKSDLYFSAERALSTYE